MEGVPIFWSSLKPRRRKPRLPMQAWANKAMASAELLRSDVVSPFSWSGRAAAMPCRMFCGLSGLLVMMAAYVEVCVCVCMDVYECVCRESSSSSPMPFLSKEEGDSC